MDGAGAFGTPGRVRPGVVWMVASVALFMNTLDTSIVNVALPSVGRDLHAGVSGLQWVVDSYTLTLAALLLSAGTAGDRFGHRRTTRIGMVLFVAASVACGSAPTTGILVVARVVQGVGASLLTASTLSLLHAAYPEPARRAQVIGWWAVFSGVGFSAGPPIGGALVALFGWRAVFLVNLVPGVFVLLLLAFGVPETRRHADQPIDGRGQLAAVAGLGGLLFGVIEGPAYGWWSMPVVATFAATIAALAAFVRIERRLAHPMLDLALFRRGSVVIGNLAAFSYTFGFLGLLFVLNLYLQTAQHRTPLAVGLLFLPLSTAVFVVGPVSGRITARFGARALMVVGLFAEAAGALLLRGAAIGTPYVLLVPALVLLGIGSSLTATPAIHSVLTSTPDRPGMGSGLIGTTRQLGASCGVAVLGTIAGSPTAPGFMAHLHAGVVVAAAVLMVAATLVLASARRRVDSVGAALPQTIRARRSSSPGAP